MNAINGSFTGRKRIRKSFGRIPEVAPMPNLIDVQRSSYEAFLQSDVKPDNRTHTGLQEVFKSVFPIDDFAGRTVSLACSCGKIAQQRLAVWSRAAGLNKNSLGFEVTDRLTLITARSVTRQAAAVP